jgi:uncharacterized phage protein (TIGR01671 family)
MREILFRGKSLDKSGVWVEGSLIHRTDFYGELCDDYFILYGGEFDCDYYDADRVDMETVGQFNGLTDKNGKKIFEGDIVKCRHRAVKFYLDDAKNINPRRSYGKEIEESDGYGFSCIYWRNYAVEIRDGVVRIKNGSDHHEIRTNYIYNHAIEVIGNIHDNPELLEGGVENGV